MRVKLKPAKCSLDIGDGSERGEYVSQDYILNKLGRPHRNVGLMYTYYPLDKEWPKRSSEAYPDMEVHGQWDYPYDDYFPYGGGLNGDKNSSVFKQMKDIRRHGQDVTLTLTIDIKVSDEHLIAIARDLRSYGRIWLRINHECAGTWFTHNRRYTYEEIGEFFVRFHDIIKREAPNVTTVFCSGFAKPDGRMEQEDAFINAFKKADVHSGDRYFSLHHGWPFDVCDTGDWTYTINDNEDSESYIELVKKTIARLAEINDGKIKPFSASEFNADGDVTGPEFQGKPMLYFAKYIMEHGIEGFSNFSLYQFRDRGRLGLEMEDPNCPEVGIEQPLMRDYKWVLKQDYFNPGIEKLENINTKDEVNIPMRWGGADDSEGILMKVKLEKKPVFFEMALPRDMNLMVSVNGRWFYKAPGIRMIDCMPAFFSQDAEALNTPGEIDVMVFAPPFDGENPVTDAEDWDLNYRTIMTSLPKLRVRYEPCK
ncbi:MAG: hypothetical protein K6E10_04125 [Eubacterium sp.]|nr:hypothetical protein [Eubacterium sp.]